MLAGALIFLTETAFGLFIISLLLRFYLQCVRASYRNPLSQFLNAITDFAVLPARRVIPGLWGLDLATLVLAWLAQLAEVYIVLQIRGHALEPTTGIGFAGLALLSVVLMAKLGLYIVMVAVIIQAMLSWFNPYSPVAPLLNSMTRPFLRMFQKRIPAIGNVDLSPLFVVIGCQLLLMVPVAYLEAVLTRLI